MNDSTNSPASDDAPSDLVPRLAHLGYSREALDQRRAAVERLTACELEHVGATTLAAEDMKGKIENPIGAAQMPLGVAGPLLVQGEHAQGVYYVPLATTEGTLVRSYERGMAAITRSGGATARVTTDQNRVTPVFTFASLADAHRFACDAPQSFAQFQAAAEATTRRGKLLQATFQLVGRDVVAHFDYATADAHGMNMITIATEQACEWLLARSTAQRYTIMSGASGEKRATAQLLADGKGKRVSAAAVLPASITQRYLQASPRELCELWHRTILAQVHAGVVGYNGHYANGLTAMFIACGQDVANVVNSSAGVTNLELTDDGQLFASVTLTSLTVATVGGGTGIGTSRECLQMLGCFGGGYARKLAEIMASTVLAGELSMAGALAHGDFVNSHKKYGRNPPPEPATP